MNYFNDDVLKTNFDQPEEDQQPDQKSQEPKEAKKPIGFAVWDVGNTGYRMKLNTAGTKELESRYRTNVISLMQPHDGETVPPLTTMLDVAHVAMKPWNHGIKIRDVESMFDRYLEAGGSQIDFFTSVYVDIFMVSGFFTKEMAEEVRQSMKEIRQSM